MSLKPTVHISVMLDEVTENAKPENGGVFIDGTFGGGGAHGVPPTADHVRRLRCTWEPQGTKSVAWSTAGVSTTTVERGGGHDIARHGG